MQIEELFRDHKSHHFGLGMRASRSYKIERLHILLLIASITSLLLYIIGCIGKKNGWHRLFKCNTVHNKNIISNVHIGWLIIVRDSIVHKFKIRKKEINQSIEQIAEISSKNNNGIRLWE